MASFLAILTLLALLVSSYGLGFATMKWAIRDETTCFSLLAVIGVACLITLGGILNLIGMAYPAGIYALLLLGMIFFMLSFHSRFKMLQHLSPAHPPSDNTKNIHLLNRFLPLSLVAIAVMYSAATLLPSGVFNFHDDFHTYIPRTFRMLQTGTLAGNPYDLLGLDSLGAQAFLQGFVLLRFPPEYLPGFDAVFGLGLAGSLLLATARKFESRWVYATLAVLTFLAINPQSVNVSALYSGVFAILGLLLASCLLTERIHEHETAKSLGMAALSGLLLSSIVALKTTLAFFAAIYIALFCLGLFATTQNRRRAALLIATIVLTAAIAILPWLLLHLPNYMAALSDHSQSAANTNGFVLPKGNVNEMFSTRTLFYGGSLLGYGSIVFLLAVLCVFSIFYMSPHSRNNDRQRGYSLVSASACLAAITTYFLNGWLFDPATAVRYSCPILIATLPFALLASGLNATFSPAAPLPVSLAQTSLKMAVLAGGAAIVALFGNNIADRTERAFNNRTLIPFPINDAYIRYNSYVFSEEARDTLRNIQNRTEPGTSILAWISMPLHLDYSRNGIFTAMEPGFANPWLDLPLNSNSAGLAQYFRKQGIRYILWEYRGTGVKDQGEYKEMLLSPYPVYRRIAERSLYMRTMLASIMSDGDFLYHQNGVVLFDLDQTR